MSLNSLSALSDLPISFPRQDTYQKNVFGKKWVALFVFIGIVATISILAGVALCVPPVAVLIPVMPIFVLTAGMGLLAVGTNLIAAGIWITAKKLDKSI